MRNSYGFMYMIRDGVLHVDCWMFILCRSMLIVLFSAVGGNPLNIYNCTSLLPRSAVGGGGSSSIRDQCHGGVSVWIEVVNWQMRWLGGATAGSRGRASSSTSRSGPELLWWRPGWLQNHCGRYSTALPLLMLC